jgi:pilus assembly protein TadC
LFGLVENVDMSRKNSLAWMSLYVLIWAVYLLSMFLAPQSSDAFLDLVLVLVAISLLVPLVLLINRRTCRAKEIAFHLAARDEFLKVHSSLGNRAPTSFFR